MSLFAGRGGLCLALLLAALLAEHAGGNDSETVEAVEGHSAADGGHTEANAAHGGHTAADGGHDHHDHDHDHETAGHSHGGHGESVSHGNNHGYVYIGEGEVKFVGHKAVDQEGAEGGDGEHADGAAHGGEAEGGEHGGEAEGGEHGGEGEHGHGGGEAEGGHEERIAKDLICLVVFWFCIWVSGRLAGITSLSPLLFYLIFGCILGNVNLGFLDLHESHFMKTFSVLAIAVVFFALGLEENVTHFLEGIKMAYGIAIIGAAVPFAVGFGCTSLFWPEAGANVALMGGLAVTATAVSLTMIALKAEGLATSKPAIGIMTSAVLDDIASLALVAVCVPIATGEASPTVLGIILVMAKAGGFFVVVIIGHMMIFPNEITRGFLKEVPIIRSFGIKNFLEWRNGEQATLISLIAGMIWGMLAILFGFHPAIGAYMGGLIMEEKYFDIPQENAHGHKNTYHEVLHHIETVAYGWMGPFFFMELGSAILVDLDVLGRVIWFTLLMYVLLFVGQFVSAAGAARFVPGGFTYAESAMIGFGMMGRAELFFVVLELCYVEHKIMDRDMVCTFAFVAMLMNVSVPVTITLFKPIYVRHHPEALLDAEAEGHGHEHSHSAEVDCEQCCNHPTAEQCGKPAVDLDMIDIKGAMITPREGEEDQDATESTGTGGQEIDDCPSGDGVQPPQQKTKPAKRNNGRSLAQVCGCVSIASADGPRFA